jgi:hypothetical protein
MTLDNIVTKMTSDHIVATMTLDHIVARMNLDVMVAFDNFVAFAIPFVALLTPSPVMWRKEHIRNFSVLQRAHISSLEIPGPF